MSGDDPLVEFKRLSKPARLACSVQTARQALKPAERKLLDLALESPKSEIRHTAISKWLEARGIECRAGAICRHRNHQCSCDDA